MSLLQLKVLYVTSVEYNFKIKPDIMTLLWSSQLHFEEYTLSQADSLNFFIIISTSSEFQLKLTNGNLTFYLTIIRINSIFTIITFHFIVLETFQDISIKITRGYSRTR